MVMADKSVNSVQNIASENGNNDEEDDNYDKYAPENRSSATAGSSLTHPRLVVFDEDHTPVTRGGAYEILIKKNCVFCKIAHEDEGRFSAKPVFQNTEVTVFSDIIPAAKIHLLVIPNTHICNVRELKKEHIPLLEYMFAAGAGGLEILGGSINEARVGFHCPPFTSMSHLHLHILYPETSIRWWNKLFFRPNSYWFTLYDSLLRSLNEMEGSPVQCVSFPMPITDSDEANKKPNPETDVLKVEDEQENSKATKDEREDADAMKGEREDANATKGEREDANATKGEREDTNATKGEREDTNAMKGENENAIKREDAKIKNEEREDAKTTKEENEDAN